MPTKRLSFNQNVYGSLFAINYGFIVHFTLQFFSAFHLRQTPRCSGGNLVEAQSRQISVEKALKVAIGPLIDWKLNHVMTSNISIESRTSSKVKHEEFFSWPQSQHGVSEKRPRLARELFASPRLRKSSPTCFESVAVSWQLYLYSEHRRGKSSVCELAREISKEKQSEEEEEVRKYPRKLNR